jgi:hypothetical protein
LIHAGCQSYSSASHVSSDVMIDWPLDWAKKENTFPMPEERNYTASYIFTGYTVYKTLCPNADTWEDKSQPQKQGE